MLKKLKTTFIDHPVFLLLISILASLMIYYPATKLYFSQDDFEWLFRASQPLLSVSQFFSPMSGFFMPLINTYFFVTYKLFHLNPLGYHLVSILWHGFNVFLVYCLIKKLFKSKLTACLGALTFLSLRFPVEAVVWVSAITALISFSVLLIMALLWLEFLETKKWSYYLGSIFALILMCLTKELAILSIPFLVIVTFWHDQKIYPFYPVIKDYFKKFWPLLIIFLIYGYWSITTQSSSYLVAAGYYGLGWHIVKNIFLNTFLLFIPLTDQVITNQGRYLLVTLVILTGGLTAYFIFFKKYFSRIFSALVWILVSFLPTALFIKWQFTSRYAYLPAIGAAIIVGTVIELLKSKYNGRQAKRLIYLGFALYLIFNIFYIRKVITVYYAPAYQDTKLFVNDLKSDLLPKNNELYIYDTEFLQTFLVSKIIPLVYQSIAPTIHELNSSQACPINQRCLYWDYNKKTILNFNGNGLISAPGQK